MNDNTGVNIIPNHHVSLAALAVMKYADEVRKYDMELALSYYDNAGKILGLSPITPLYEKKQEKIKEWSKNAYKPDPKGKEPVGSKPAGRRKWGWRL